MQPEFSLRRSGSSRAELPNVFTFRRSISWVLSEEYLNKRLTDAKTLQDYQALVKLAELGSWSEGRRGNLRGQQKLLDFANQIRASVLLPSHRSFSGLHTTD